MAEKKTPKMAAEVAAHGASEGPERAGDSFTIRATGLPALGETDELLVRAEYPSREVTYSVEPTSDGTLELAVNPIEAGEVLIRIFRRDAEGNLERLASLEHTV